jgi:aryl-alcohol dehydrogenase-like predicted oxidoreductase
VQTRTIGDRQVSAIGLGGMPLSIEGRPDTERAIRTIHAALDAGVTLIDTADSYHLNAGEVGHNERLIAQGLATYDGDTSHVLVATKGGHLRPGDGSWTIDGRPEHIRAACEASLKALGVDAIGLYQYHRPDPKVPWAESVGALKELRDAGKIQLMGVSNATAARIREAVDVLGGTGATGLASVQNEFSPRFRSSEPELELCAELGVAFLPWSPLGGIGSASKLGAKHAAFEEVAAAHGVSPQRVCLAWMLAKAPVVIPIPGSSRPETIQDSVQAADLELSADELARLG